MAADLIRVRDLDFAYPDGGFRLQVPHLAVGAGETLALTGPSGCGKTTLVHLIAGILQPAAGSILVAGLDMARLPPADRRDLRILRVGLVFQELELLDYLSVLDNVLLPYRLTSALELTGEVRDRAESLLERTGLADKRRREPARLSQGERQRVAVCRALVTRPALVLGDEPTGNLDPASRDRVIDTLLGYAEQADAPVLIVTHDHQLLPRFGRTLNVTALGVTALDGTAPTGDGRG